MRGRFGSGGGGKLAMLGALTLGLGMMARRRHRMAHLYGRGFGGYGPWSHGGEYQAGSLPPWIESILKAWHDRAHGQTPPEGGASPQGAGPTTV